MLATVRSVGETDSFTADYYDVPASGGGFISFVSPPFDFTRALRFQAVSPASSQHFEARRHVFDLEDDFRDLLGDNPALLTGLLPQESPRWLTAKCELGIEIYIG